MTFLDNPLFFLYFGFCLILNQCYFSMNLWLWFWVVFSYWKIDNPMWCWVVFFFLWLWIYDVDWNWKLIETKIQPKLIDFQLFRSVLIGNFTNRKFWFWLGKIKKTNRTEPITPLAHWTKNISMPSTDNCVGMQNFKLIIKWHIKI